MTENSIAGAARRVAAAALVITLAITLTGALLGGAAAWAQTRSAVRNGDYIVAVDNQELVTAVEVDQRLERAREASSRAGQRSDDLTLRKQVLDALIDDRVVVTYARDGGAKVEEPELERAVLNVAMQNQLSIDQLRQRLKEDGIDYARFRSNLRDQMLVERVREREVYQRIRVTDAEVDRFVDKQRADAQADAELNVAQILVSVPEGADPAAVQARQQRAAQALARVRGGEAFDQVARELSEDGNREKGGEIGLRQQSRLPDLFVEAVRALKAGDVAPALVRSGAGFHVLKLLERREGAALRVTQTRPRHILLRLSEKLSAEVAGRRLSEFKRQVESGSRKFEDLARQFSEDGSASAGGDLGWLAQGALVPEFEQAMDRLAPGALSDPVLSRFGVHLIQVIERRDVPLDNKQLREQARSALREQKFEETYAEWAKDLRSRAYIEMREPPL